MDDDGALPVTAALSLPGMAVRPPRRPCLWMGGRANDVAYALSPSSVPVPFSIFHLRPHPS
jgi:hypothetical protein